MKKIFYLITILMILSAAFVFADDVYWGSMYSEGNLTLGGDLSYEAGIYGSQLALYPAADMIFLKPVIEGLGFFDIGAAVKGRIGIPLSPSTGFSVGVGALGSLHFGLRGLELPGAEYFERLDLFAEVGVKFDLIPANPADILGLALSSGVNYFIDDGLAVGAAYTNWGSFGGGGASIFIRLGEKPAVKGVDIDWQEDARVFAVQPYLLQFYTLFYSVHFAGGFYPEGYPTGKGTVHRVSIMDGDGEDSYLVEKALLKKLPDNRLLWKMEYRDDEESVYYEFITDAEYKINTVYFDSEDDGIIELPADEDIYPESDYKTWEDYGADVKKNITIDVEAGSFKTDEYSYEDESGVVVNWWLAQKVPGSLVSYKMEDASDIVISELIEITSNNKAVLYKK